MEALQTKRYNRSDHGIVFNAIAYTCGGVYALGQLTFQGIEKVFVAGWDTTYELGSNSFSAMNEEGKAISFASYHVFCVARIVWGVVSPIFREPWDYTCAFFFEIWKILRSLPEEVLRLTEVPGSVIGGLIRQLCSDSKAGLLQLAVFAKFVFEIIKQVRDFGTIGAFVKDGIQLLGSGLNEIIKTFVVTWKETEIPRILFRNTLRDLFDSLKSGLGELNKGLDLGQRAVFSGIRTGVELVAESLIGTSEHAFYGCYQVYKGLESSERVTFRGLKILFDLLGKWLNELGAYLISGICEIMKLSEATKEDLGNSWQNFIVDPIEPYAKQVHEKICEVLVDIEKVVLEVQKTIFGT